MSQLDLRTGTYTRRLKRNAAPWETGYEYPDYNVDYAWEWVNRHVYGRSLEVRRIKPTRVMRRKKSVGVTQTCVETIIDLLKRSDFIYIKDVLDVVMDENPDFLTHSVGAVIGEFFRALDRYHPESYESDLTQTYDGDKLCWERYLQAKKNGRIIDMDDMLRAKRRFLKEQYEDKRWR